MGQGEGGRAVGCGLRWGIRGLDGRRKSAKIGENRGKNSRRKNINHVHFSGPISRLLGLWQLLLGSTDAKRSPIALQPCAWPSHWSKGNGRNHRGEVLPGKNHCGQIGWGVTRRAIVLVFFSTPWPWRYRFCN